MPFERLIEILQPQRSLSQNPLFQVLYNHQRRASADPPPRLGLEIEKIDADVTTVKFDLALDSEEGPSGEICAIFTYATALFEAATMQRLAGHWTTILRSMIADDAAPSAGLRCCPSDERDELHGWSQPADVDASPRSRCIARWPAMRGKCLTRPR